MTYEMHAPAAPEVEASDAARSGSHVSCRGALSRRLNSSEPIVVQLETEDPNVVILWITRLGEPNEETFSGTAVCGGGLCAADGDADQSVRTEEHRRSRRSRPNDCFGLRTSRPHAITGRFLILRGTRRSDSSGEPHPSDRRGGQEHRAYVLYSLGFSAAVRTKLRPSSSLWSSSWNRVCTVKVTRLLETTVMRVREGEGGDLSGQLPERTRIYQIRCQQVAILTGHTKHHADRRTFDRRSFPITNAKGDTHLRRNRGQHGHRREGRPEDRRRQVHHGTTPPPSSSSPPECSTDIYCKRPLCLQRISWPATSAPRAGASCSAPSTAAGFLSKNCIASPTSRSACRPASIGMPSASFTRSSAGLTVAGRGRGLAIDGIGVDTWGVDFGLLGDDGALVDNPRHYRDPRTNGHDGTGLRRPCRKKTSSAIPACSSCS